MTNSVASNQSNSKLLNFYSQLMLRDSIGIFQSDKIPSMRLLKEAVFTDQNLYFVEKTRNFFIDPIRFFDSSLRFFTPTFRLVSPVNIDDRFLFVYNDKMKVLMLLRTDRSMKTVWIEDFHVVV